MRELSRTIQVCRELLEAVTPLKKDCGAICGGVCCRSLEGEETGMLLFPGEEAYYADLTGYRIVPGDAGPLLICSGTCDRADRPLSCRLFPLLPLLREDDVKVNIDRRAHAVCPLAVQGKRAMDPSFVEKVRSVGASLAKDPETRPFLEKLTRMNDELLALQRAFGGR